ncbi:MAG: restriction endonuclease, partial [Ruminococcus sp.]|nr:restriction endonuclease [Ruminococcus sp.]
KKNHNLIEKYKVKISIMVPQGGEVGIKPENGYRSISTPQIIYPNQVDSFSYLNVGFFDSEIEATNLVKYLCCKFTRFLIRTTYSSVHVSKENFCFVPLWDFHREWTDKDLYSYFDLTSDEIELIEKTMRPMELGGE